MPVKPNDKVREDFFNYLRDKTNRTSRQDLVDLKFANGYGREIPIFIYDDLQFGEDNHHLMEGAYYYGPAVTFSDEFVLCKKRFCEPETILFTQDFNNEMKEDMKLARGNYRRVTGELYGIPLDSIYWFDNFYRNKTEFNRIEIPIVLERGFQIIKFVQTYVGVYNFHKRAKKVENRLCLAPTLQKKNSNEWLYRHSYGTTGLQGQIDRLLLKSHFEDDLLSRSGYSHES